MDFNPIAPAVQDVLTAIRHRKRIDEVVELILDRSCQICNALHGSFITVNDAQGRLAVTSTHGADWTLDKQACRLKIGEGITGRVAATGKPYLCPDVTKDPNYYPLFPYVRSELSVPVIVSDKIWGIINIDGLTVNAFDENTLSTLTVFAELAAFAITLRIELNEQERLQRHLIQSEKLASLGEIIAGIAHEINNPLTSILANASLLSLGRGGDRDEASVRAILEESRRCAELVKNLLSFSRQEIGDKEIIGVNEILSQVVSVKKYQLKVNNIQFVTETGPISYPLMVSPAQIQQILLNLINNAEHAIPSTRSDGRVFVSVKREGEKIKIRVQDNGAGIPPETQRYIFDPFFTTKPEGEGTGLGLSIAKTIAEAHGGNLFIESSSAQGSVFCLELPMAMSPETPRTTVWNDPPVNSAPTRVAPPLPAPIGRVLLVDDEPLILESLADYLISHNVEVRTLIDSSAAAALLGKERFDVILSDIRMPGIDGLQLYERARVIDRRYAKNFVFMSGDLVRVETKMFIRNSGCPCLEKPFTMESMFQTLRAYFPA